MVCGKLHGNNYDPFNVLVVVTNTERREELSLQYMDGMLLRVLVLKEELSGASLTPGSEVSVSTLVSGSSSTSPARDGESFSVEEKHVEEVLSLMETDLTNTQLQLQLAREEIVCLRKELSAQQKRLL